MVWTAELTKKNRSSESLDFVVEFHNGIDGFKKSFVAKLVGNSEEWLKGQVRSTIANLDFIDDLENKVNIGVIDISLPDSEPDNGV